MGLSNTSRRPLYVFILVLLLIVALVSSLKASGHSTRFLQLSSLSSLSSQHNSALCSTTSPPFPSSQSATIVILVNPGSNHYQVLLPTLQNLEEKFNRRFGYPIQLLTDGELPDEGVRKRTEWITGGKAKWCESSLRFRQRFRKLTLIVIAPLQSLVALVTPEQGWGPPSWITEETTNASIARMGFSKGYRFVSSFFRPLFGCG